MINTWFTVKVKYTKQFQNGTLKRVSEPYLLGANSSRMPKLEYTKNLEQELEAEFRYSWNF